MVKVFVVCSDKIFDKIFDVGFIEVFLDFFFEKVFKDFSLFEDFIMLFFRLYELLIKEVSKYNVSVENFVESVYNYAKRYVFEKYFGDESVLRNKR